MANMFMPPAIPTLTVGGRVFTDLENLIQLKAYVEGTTNVRGTARKLNASAGYQVPVGKKFVIKAVRIIPTYASANALYPATIVYADNDVGVAAATAFTNEVDIGGSVLISQLGAMLTTAFTLQEFILNFEVPAGKYIGVRSLTSSVTYAIFDIFGYEVPA